MPTSNKRAPAIRFSGFVGEWKENTMGSLGTFSKGAALSKADISDEGFPLILYGELYTAYGEIIEKVYRKTRKEVGNEQKSQGGDVIIPTSGETPDEISSAACVMIPGVILAGDLSIYRNCYIDGRIVSYIVRHVINKQIASIAQGKSVVHIRMDELAKIPLIYPSQMEQQKLAIFLSNVDKLIELRKNKLDKLIALKRELLNKLFPQQGQKIPAIRFSGFVEEWKRKKFADTVMIERGGSPRPIEAYVTHDTNGLNWVKIGDAPEFGNYITQTAEKIRPEGLKKTREVHPDDLILSNSMSFGRPYIMKIMGCIHDGWLLIRNNRKIFDLHYLCYMLSTNVMLCQYEAMAAGSTVHNLNKELVGNTFINYPEINEQARIGQFFRTLDKLIELRKKELDGLNNVKFNFLNKMFV